MPSKREVAAALYGAWRLLRFDPQGFVWFDLTIDGFWRSFFAAVLVAPAYLILVALDLTGREGPIDGVWATFVLTLGYGAEWIAFPIAAIFITRLLGLTEGYVPLIVAGNWIGVPQSALVALAGAIDEWGGLAGAIGPFITLSVTLYVLIYQWFVTRLALNTSGLTAAGVVILQILIVDFVHLGAMALV